MHASISSPLPPIFGVVVTYYPNEASLDNIANIASQFERILLVDNSCDQEVVVRLRMLAARIENIRLHFCARNLGTAGALNIGFRYAQKKGLSWVMTLDQDTELPLGGVGSMFNAWNMLSDGEKLLVKLIAPCYMYIGKKNFTCGEIAQVLPNIVITSANLVHITLWEELGGYDENLVIDYVDTDFCLKMLLQGFRILVVPTVRVVHALGQVETCKILWHKVSFTRYGAGRRYFQFRNRVILYKKYWRRTSWIQQEIYQLVKDIIKIAICEGCGNIKAASIGFIDGIRGRKARMDPAVKKVRSFLRR